jgi:Mn2+/Fe2+ NRAMP family transporter
LTNTENIDNYGHLGGFVTGLPLSMAVMPIVKSSMKRDELRGWTYEKYCKAIGVVAVTLWILIGMIMFFAVRKPGSNCP